MYVRVSESMYAYISVHASVCDECLRTYVCEMRSKLIRYSP